MRDEDGRSLVPGVRGHHGGHEVSVGADAGHLDGVNVQGRGEVGAGVPVEGSREEPFVMVLTSSTILTVRHDEGLE